MDRLVDHLFVFEGDGVIKDFPGNYSRYREWLRDSEPNQLSDDDKQVAKEEPVLGKKNQKESTGKRSPSFKEKREFEQLQKEIDELNKERAMITERLNSNNTPYQELQELSIRIGVVNQLIDEKELRWLELSEII
jgi:ATP-binding cassette subfamily F protein uup